MTGTDNPYSVTTAKVELDKLGRPPRMLFAFIAMPILAIVFFTIAIESSRFLLGWLIDRDPAYWIDRFEIPEDWPAARQRQRLFVLADRYSTIPSAFGFFVGLLLPWVRYFWLTLGHPSKTNGGE